MASEGGPAPGEPRTWHLKGTPRFLGGRGFDFCYISEYHPLFWQFVKFVGLVNRWSNEPRLVVGLVNRWSSEPPLTRTK